MMNYTQPVFDVERLDMLLAKGDYQQLKQDLLTLLKDVSGIDWIFLLDKYIFSFSEEEILNTPQFTTFATVSAALKGDIGKAKKYAKLLGNNLLLSHYINVYMPFTDNKTFRESITYLITTQNFHATFASNRPSIVNGLRDFTFYNRYLEQFEQPLRKMMQDIYSDQSFGMYEVALAEYYYQTNKCYEALSLVDSVINVLENSGNSYVLQAALFVKFSVFVTKGQAKKIQPLIDDFEYKITKVNYTLYPGYIESLRAWCAIYDGDFAYVEKWLENKAPQDYEKVTLMDIFNIMVKLRVYLQLGRYYLLISLVIRIIPILESLHRIMDKCEANLIYAMALWADNNTIKAYEILDETLPIVKQFQYYRLVADEGLKMYDLLRAYKKARNINDDLLLDMLISLSKGTGLLYPSYLKKLSENYPTLTDTEKSVLRLMADERTNADIAEYMSVSINTIKFHSKNIFLKLNVNNRHQAIKIAQESNII